MSVFFTGQALQIAGTGTRKCLIKLKPFFSMHVVIYIYSGRCCQDKTKKHANKYTGKIHDVQINIVQLRISKTKNYGGKKGGVGGREKKKRKCFPGEIAGLAAQKLISNITFGFTVIFTIIHSKCSMQASSFSLRRGWGAKERGRTRWKAKRRKKMEKGEEGERTKHTRTCTHAHTHTHTHTHTP